LGEGVDDGAELHLAGDNCDSRGSRDQYFVGWTRNFLPGSRHYNNSGRTGMLSDENLILEYQHGSRQALDELFARYSQPLYSFFRRRLTGKDRAEDLTQETFLAIIRNSVRYEPKAQFRTYLYGIAMNLLAAERRKQCRSREQLNEVFAGSSEVAEPALWVREALEKLSREDREILMLREYEQLSYSEIATLLRIPLNTVRSRLFRSRLSLKGHLEPASRASAPKD
jgi:RNA polymerase sigma-70 factor (ECF subfamily)